MKIVKLFGLLITLCLTITSCQKEDNQLVIMNNQINELVKQEEEETNNLQTYFDPIHNNIDKPQAGLSVNYVIGCNNHYFTANSTSKENNLLAENSILAKIPWSNLSSYQKENIYNAFQQFETQQAPTVKTATELLSLMNNSLKQQILEMHQKIEKKLITESQYDKRMTDIQDTFYMNIRSIYEEHKIYINCSNHYRSLLEEIQKILTMKQWEVFFSCVYKE